MGNRKVNHECKTCGNWYWACNDCERIGSWRVFCDTPECYQVLACFLEWRDNHHDAAAFARKVDEIGYDPEKLIPSMKKIYDEGKN